MKIRKILIVDNNATIVELLASYFSKEGFQILKAYDGIDALDRLEETELLPDVILLDLVMPKIDGQRLTRILKTDERYAGIPIIILSGIAAEEDGKIMSFGADAYIAKGKIDETFVHIKDTIKWLEERTEVNSKQEEILGADKLFPREMTRELLLVKQHFDTMFQLMQEGVIEVDQDSRVLFANPAAQRLLCQEDHLLFGRPIHELFDDGDRLQEFLEKAPQTPRDSFESLQLTCGNHIARAIATPFFHEEKHIGSIVMLQDITSLINREKSLEGLMSAIVRNAPVGLCLLDDNGEILVANQALSRIFHQPDSWESEGASIIDVLSALSPLLSEAVAQSLDLEAGKSLAHQADFSPGFGKDRQVVNVTATALGVSAREKVLLLVEDVTEKSLLEEGLRHANQEMERANHSKNTFLSMVSHELRTPLSVVRGYLSLILEGKIGPDPEKILDALKVADKRARHLQHLIEELLDLSRIEAGKLLIRKEVLGISKHLRETVEMFRDDMEQKGLTIAVDIPDDLPPIVADHDKIHQVFTNLISNAVKFSNKGGTVGVSAKAVGHSVEIKVRDSGIGIPTDRIDRIFDKFYQVDSSDTRKHAGTGLGLSIVKMILSALGGTIHVTSEIGKGTTFSFTLPAGSESAADVAQAPEPKKAAASPVDGKRKRILVVEDDPDTRDMIRIFLEGENYEVITMDNAFDGLREIYRHPPDLVLADALLPFMTGLDLCRSIRANPQTEKMPVAILSAAAQEDEIRSGYEVGANEYLVKPFTSQDLSETIRKISP